MVGLGTLLTSIFLVPCHCAAFMVSVGCGLYCTEKTGLAVVSDLLPKPSKDGKPPYSGT